MTKQSKKNMDKKAQVLGSNRGGSSKGLAALVVVAVLALAGGLSWWLISPGSGEAPQAASLATVNGEKVVALDETLFTDGKARHFELKGEGGVLVRYFVIKSSDGVIRAAYDACDVCWPEGKGYYQQGDDMVCANCGKHFPSIKVNEIKGGCNPAPLQRKVENGKVIIRLADIMDGRRYFNFTKRG
ncbi:DUF2318 domain-containing protein [Desulfoferula mesophila]|uniref:Membrane iron-sulfur containing protein FtrD-like domain-containing protein n=1 Tax=Desulfoferula mesophila TaxID=3058419 RepID=A0AAU9F162_9BACT|nr:hypothetical protein FAK_39020 [Desulfoferula mesophilus]